MGVIGIAGQLSTGKDSVADYIVSKLGWKKIPLAKHVKRIYCETFGVDLEFVEKWKRIDDPPPGFDMNVRKSLQFIGDGFRKIKGSIWIELLFQNAVESFALSDCRYINEIRKVKELKGLMVLMYRPDFENDDPNDSEAQIKPLVDWFKSTGREGYVTGELVKECPEALVDAPIGVSYIDLFLINDGTLEDLHKKIDKFILSDSKYKTT